LAGLKNFGRNSVLFAEASTTLAWWGSPGISKKRREADT
jgi:hypothetical protein